MSAISPDLTGAPPPDLTGADLTGVDLATPPDLTPPPDLYGSPPVLLSSAPVSGATAVPLTTSIALTFSQPMNTSQTSATLSPSVALGAGVWTVGDTVVTFQPSVILTAGTNYTVAVTGHNKLGGVLPASSVTFGTSPIDTTAPTVISTIPANSATEVQPNTPISIKFSEEMNPSTTSVSLGATIIGTARTVPTSFGVWSEGFTRLTLTNPPALLGDATYTVTINGSDHAGNALATTVFTFLVFETPGIAKRDETGFGFDYMPHYGPVSNSVAGTQIGLFFTKAMNHAATEGAITIIDQGTKGTGNTPVTCACTASGCSGSGWVWADDNNNNPFAANRVTCGAFISGTGGILSPARTAGHIYQVTITNAATDTTGHAIVFDNKATSFSWQFAIQSATPPADTTPPTVVSVSPALDAINQAANPPVPLVITFSEPMDTAATAGAFTISAGGGGTIAWTNSSTVMTYTPRTTWPYATGAANNITFTISTNAKDSAATENAMAAPYLGGFRTLYSHTTALAVVTTSTGTGFVYDAPFVPASALTVCGLPIQAILGDPVVGAFSNAECNAVFGFIVAEQAARGFLLFDVTALKPVLKVTNAHLDLFINEVDGVPSQLGTLKVYNVWNAPGGAIVPASYTDAPVGATAADFPIATTSGLKVGDVTAVVGPALGQRAAQNQLLQLRLQWTTATLGLPFQNTGYKTLAGSTFLRLTYESDQP